MKGDTPEAVLRDAFARARAGNLAPDLVRVVPGFCGERMRAFLHHLGQAGPRYLEVGIHRGATFCSLLHGTPATGLAIDDWSQFGDHCEEFTDTCRRLLRPEQYTFIRADCWTVDLRDNVFDVLFYDADHAEDCQARALAHFRRWLAPVAILIVDDWNWAHVRRGTAQGLLGYDVLAQEVERTENEQDSAGWWNGVAAFVVRKRET